MKIKFIHILFTIAIFVQSGRCEQIQLQSEIRPFKRVYVVGEPVVLCVTLKNNTYRATKVTLSMSYPSFGFIPENENQVGFIRFGTPMASASSGDFVDLQPEESKQCLIVTDPWVKFIRPGKYRFSVSMNRPYCKDIHRVEINILDGDPASLAKSIADYENLDMSQYFLRYPFDEELFAGYWTDNSIPGLVALLQKGKHESALVSLVKINSAQSKAAMALVVKTAGPTISAQAERLLKLDYKDLNIPYTTPQGRDPTAEELKIIQKESNNLIH